MKLLFALVLCGVALAQQPPKPQQRQNQRPAPEPPKPAAYMRLKPGSIQFDDGPPKPSDNPFAEALTRSQPGTLIEVESGDYPAFTMGFGKGQRGEAMTHGGSAGSPVVVRGIGETKPRITPGGGDTLAITQAMKVGHIRFENLLIVGGYRAAVIFYKLDNPEKSHDGFEFIDCEITGAWDHFAKRGTQSKWGIWGHNMKDFVFKGTDKPAVVRDICHEHAFYLQNARGDITLENIRAMRLGRTFCQFTARASDGKPGTGTITVKNCVVEDACIAAGDNYKGGSAFTFAGRHEGTILVENNRYRAGFAKGIQALTRPGEPYGTGALVAWDYKSGPSAKLILRDNDFAIAQGCGDRPLVSIGGCREVELAGTNRFIGGGNEHATFELDPMDENGPTNTLVGAFKLDPTTAIEGRIWIGGKFATFEQLLERGTPKEKPPGDK